MIPFFIGLFLGILLSAIAIAWEVSKDKPTLVWMDENYKLHLVKKRK
jgi:hypothetical protein